MSPRRAILPVLALFARLAAAQASAPDGYLPSERCVECHADRHASWARTFHRSMTREAGPDTVKGNFNGAIFDYLGVRATMSRRGGKPVVTLRAADGTLTERVIVRTVGSRRIQQYLAWTGKNYTRLPVAWHLEKRRWMHLNGSFFRPDSLNYDQHTALWDANCIFCHNVKAKPGYDESAGAFRSSVAELGIACGSCHGPGAAHARAAADPAIRARWEAEDLPETLIVNPARLDPARSLMVCGKCHGQRTPNPFSRIRQFLVEGDPWDAGEDLHEFITPVSPETKLPTSPIDFSTRFWNDGSPRLSAYEYQGILGSACFQKGAGETRLQCITCHDAHAGDPKGMIRPLNRTDKPCLDCHAKFSPPAPLIAHTGHPADSPGSRCMNCHMPKVAYGIMDFHPTHKISVPDPGLTISKQVPNACNLCHLNQSAAWALRAAAERWPARFSAPESIPAPYDGPEGERMLFAGDAVARALAANRMGALPARARAGLPDRAWARPRLLAAFMTDDYPVVRYFAADGLPARPPVSATAPDYLATPAQRARAAARWRALIGAPALAEAQARREALMPHRSESDVEVGE